MCAARVVVTRDDLDGLARAAVGGGRRLAGVSRLRGGSKKGVYRLAFDDGSTAVAYLWAEDENYWPAVADDSANPFSAGSGVSLFEAANRELQAAGVRTPQVYLIDRSGGTATGTSCEQVVLDRALAHLAEAAWRDGRIGAVRSQLESVLGELAGAAFRF